MLLCDDVGIEINHDTVRIPREISRRKLARFMAKRKLKKHLIDREWCKGCGICVHFCPKYVLELDADNKVFAARPQTCVCCMSCEIRCPDLAIEVLTEEVSSQPDEKDEKREDSE